MLRSGGVQKSLAALTALHSALDETRPKDNEELQGIFRISLNYPKQNVYCLTYLLSGICSKADMTQPMKAQQFLIEGIKVVDRMTMHLGGQLDEALDWYGICLSHTQGSHQDPEGYEAKTLAIINTALIHCGERFYDLQKVKDLQMEARARHESNMSANIRQHLQEALKLSSALMNTQLRSLTLLLLGNVYLQTHDEQAEKMLMTGFVHAEKTGNQIVAAAAGSCLKDLYLTTSQGIKASQQAQKNLPVMEAVDQAFQSRLMAPLLNDTDAEQK
ncbi:hypothetical protein BGZ58_004765 [Dissophora ornata]|nr:hypothetical protein BGZ58_004765 [Dissophora ornata]